MLDFNDGQTVYHAKLIVSDKDLIISTVEIFGSSKDTSPVEPNVIYYKNEELIWPEKRKLDVAISKGLKNNFFPTLTLAVHHAVELIFEKMKGR